MYMYMYFHLDRRRSNKHTVLYIYAMHNIAAVWQKDFPNFIL